MGKVWNRVKVNVRPQTYAALRTICKASGKTLDGVLREMIWVWVCQKDQENRQAQEKKTDAA